MSELDPYTQAMDEALDQLGVERPPVTSWELFEHEPHRVATVEAIARKQEAWGEVISEAMRAMPSVDADVWVQRPPHTPDDAPST